MRLQNSKASRKSLSLKILQRPYECQDDTGSLQASCWLQDDRDGARDAPACLYSYLDVLSLRRCGSSAKVVRFLPCTVATTVTALLAPVRQEAAQSRAVSSGLPSATVLKLAVLWESALRSVCSCGTCRDGVRQRATAGHVRMASSRSPAAAGIAHPRQWLAWTRLCGCDVVLARPVTCACVDEISS